ncbi:Potassium-transporting ATPase KdpC subunit [bioreactor metagenome]|uniref:Potassium-transporting ATPase KdpC subunit n=1 Tax=bioreactor metagenome TaxID=1076179 RepID=A0A645DTX1_9ZZZZ|nr:potassium-transporting ATPase subunit KdpC [Romboutsia lituseburensis]
MKVMSYVKRASLILLIMTVITGVVYPLAVTAFAQVFVNDKANGSIIYENNKAIGSKYIGQNFVSLDKFWSRPSATSDYPYNSMASAGSNKTPTGKEYEKILKERIDVIRANNPDKDTKIPVDLVTASASGLDPDISLEAAQYQIDRVSKYSNISKDKINNLIDKHTEKKFLGIFGEEKVNVLELNLDLEKLKK